MKQWWLSGSVQLWFLISLSAGISLIAIQPGVATEATREQLRALLTNQGKTAAKQSPAQLRRVGEIEPQITSAQLLVQSPSSEVVQVTGVKANPTDQGVEVILQTTQGKQLQISDRSAENNFIADIPNAQLRLPSGEVFIFRSEKPVAGIAQIVVTNLDANTIRVTVVGEEGLPIVKLFDSPEEGLIFGITTASSSAQQPQPEQPTSEAQPQTPTAQGDESIEIVVTGEQGGYRVPDTSVGTRTDTPLRDIPQSIQVIPQEVIRDQGADVYSALRNVASIRQNNPSSFSSIRLSNRGFFIIDTLRAEASEILLTGIYSRCDRQTPPIRSKQLPTKVLQLRLL